MTDNVTNKRGKNAKNKIIPSECTGQTGHRNAKWFSRTFTTGTEVICIP